MYGRVLLSVLSLASASVGAPAETAFDWPSTVHLERRALGEHARLVLHTDASSPVVAVCTATPAPPPPNPELSTAIARRGGIETESRVGALATWCATVPKTELGFALYAAWKQWPPASARLDTTASAWPGSTVSWPPLPGSVELARIAPEPEPDRPPDPDGAAAERFHDVALEGASVPPPAPDRCLVVAGDTTSEEVTPLVSRYFGTLSDAPPDPRPPWTLHQSSERLSVLEGSVETPHVRTGWAVPDLGPANAAALAVAFDVLSNRPSAALPRNLSQRGITRGVRSFRLDLPGGTIVGLVLSLSSKASADRARRFVDGSLRKLRLAGPSAREVRGAQRRLQLAALDSWADLERRARLLAGYELVRGNAQRFLDEVESLAAVTPESVRSLAHARLVDRARTTIETYPARWSPDDPKLARYRLYTVEDGDTLAGLAERFHTTVAALARANDFDPRYRLLPGQPLWVPPP